MKSRVLTVAAVAVASALTLAGCSQPAGEEDLGGLDTIGDTNVLDAITDELQDVDTVVADAKNLFFDAGYYRFTYTETPADFDFSGKVTASGLISFRDDGSCAFNVDGTQEFSESSVNFTYVKDFRNTATLRFEGEDFDRVDPAEYESVLSLKLPPLGPFPRSADFAGFCGLQSMSEYVERAERAPGTGTFNNEKANEFVAKQMDSHYTNVYDALGVAKYTPEEAREIMTKMYAGAEIMPIWDAVIEYGTDADTGVVTIKSGTPGESNYAEMVMTPIDIQAQERNLEYVQEYAVTWDDQLQFFLEVYGSGDEYLSSLAD